MNPYRHSPKYETEHLALRLVKSEDAPALLGCYSDPVAVRLMNADHCTSDFHYQTLSEMEECIRFWLESYQRGEFVRLAVLPKGEDAAIGTVEMFDGEFEGYGRAGVLRVDLKSDCEHEELLSEIYTLALVRFFADFGSARILTKAIPEAEKRVAALKRLGFSPETGFPRGAHYWRKDA